jgi:biotin carboxylase
MRRALDEFVIEGIKTTIPFHRQLMDDPRYIAGDYTTAFVIRMTYKVLYLHQTRCKASFLM